MKDNAHTERIDNADSVQAAATGSDEGAADDGGPASAMAMIDRAAAQAETAMHHLGALIEDRFADVDADVDRLAQAAPQAMPRARRGHASRSTSPSGAGRACSL